MPKRVLILLAVCTLFLQATAAVADVVVIVNPKSGVEKLSRDEVINIFLGRFRQMPSGISALPADLPPGEPGKAAFYQQLVNKDLAEINSYWARLFFSGRTSPPRQAASNEDLLQWVATTAGGIGYIERAKVDGRVRIVYKLAP